MKDFFRGLAMITATLLIFPAVSYLIGVFAPPEPEAVEASAEAVFEAPETAEFISEVRVYDTVKQRAITLTAEEYLAAALAAQLSPEAEPELLKAQAVLMYTYILKRRLDETEAPTAELFGCDISVYRDAANAVLGEYCAYLDEPISVAYCYSAGTATESAETVLGIDVPYLQSVPSAEPDAYYTTVSYTSDEVFARLTTTDSGYVLLGGAEGWITPKETAPSGYVKSVYLDSRFVVSGAEIASLLNLPSARFTYRYSSATDRFTFTVSGSGSLVGLSQRGGNALAKQGFNYKEILLKYFSDIEIKSSKAPEQ